MVILSQEDSIIMSDSIEDQLNNLGKSVERLSPEEFLTASATTSKQTLDLLKSLYDLTKLDEKDAASFSTFSNQSPSLLSSEKRKKKQGFSLTEIPLQNLIVKDFDDDQIWEEIQLQNNFIYESLVSSVSKVLSQQNRPAASKSEEDDSAEELLKDLKNDKSQEFLQDDEVEDDLNFLDDEVDKSSEDEALLSNFEKKRRKIEKSIKEMEDEALKPKPWQLTGEVTAGTRPENSLLEEHLIYDHLIKQAPEITLKTSQKLEDIIKDRIKDKSWDDVTRKIKPIEDPYEFKKRLILDAEKSKMSLTEIYEKEYVEKHKKLDGEAEEEKEPEEHKKIQKDMRDLFHKLDALSNYCYTPKPPSADIRIITNAPAITMEEVAPVTVSDATLLAPQEVLEPSKNEIKGHAERTKTDMKRERRLKKKKQHLKRLSQEEKARARGLGMTNIKLAETVIKKAKKDGKTEKVQQSKELKSSTAFFAKLQEQVTTHIDKVAKRKKSTLEPKALTAKKFKL